MKKIMIIGCPGSGKTTFAKKLHGKTGIPLYHLDMIWHLPDKTTVSREEFDKRLKKILEKNEWIIDGNYNRTLELRAQKCDTLFFIDLPVDECIAGVESRIGKKRDDMPWTEEGFDPEFRKWILDFPTREYEKIQLLIKKYSDKNIIIFKTRNEVDEYVESLANGENI
ncbi:MAG: adenylate kinase [Clostridia bacterium]|nr:adenylate kinase [Clostridia bacterium]